MSLQLCGMSVHIGEKIKVRAGELRIGPTELGKLINTSKQNIYGIFKRKTVDTWLLQKLSDALDYNFFVYYYPAEKVLREDSVQYRKSGQKSSEETIAELTRKLETTKKELADLQEKYELLKKVNELLEKKSGSE